eukprot:403371892
MKSYKLIMVAALAAMTMATVPAVLLRDDPVKESDEVLAYRTNAAIMKGVIDGYYRGMYKQPNYVVNGECLGEKTIQDLSIINTAYDSGNFSFGNVAVPFQEVVYLFIKHCEFDDALFDFFKWCTNNDCSFNTMLQTLLKKVFQVTTVANDLAQKVTSEKPKSNDYVKLQEFYLDIGVAFGKILRYATNFDATLLNK